MDENNHASDAEPPVRLEPDIDIENVTEAGTNDSPDMRDEEAREQKVMTVWRSASRLFSGLRYGVSGLKDTWFQTRRQFGDTITSSYKLQYWQKLRLLTDTLDDHELEYLRVLANKRFDFTAAIFRVNAITSITIPVTAAVVVNQIYPGSVQNWIEDDSLTLVIGFLILLIMLIKVFGNVFKARELKMALDLEAARRRLHREEFLEAEESAENEFDFDSPLT